MAYITITTRDADRIAKKFNDLIRPKGLLAIRRKAVNTVGASIRKRTRAVGPVVYSTSAAALMVQGKAASPGSDDPRYALRMAAAVPVGRLKASARKVTKRRGGASLTLTLPGGKKIAFRSIHREGRRFRLLRAGPLVERGVGGVSTNADRAFGNEGYPELQRLRRLGEKELPLIVSALIEAHMRGRRN